MKRDTKGIARYVRVALICTIFVCKRLPELKKLLVLGLELGCL